MLGGLTMKDRRFKWGLFGLVVLLGLFGGWYGTAHATASKPTNFTAMPLLPKNQLTKQADYYDLHVTPGTTQVLKLAVSNPGSTSRTLKVIPINATTADAGNAVYVPSNRTDSSAQTTFTKMTTPAVTITLAPHQGKTVTFRTKIPSGGFRGQVLGGLFVTDVKATVPKPEKHSQNFRLDNRYAEVTAVSLWCHPKQVLPIQLKLAAVKVGLQGDQPMVFAKIRNLTPMLFGELKIKARVIQDQTGKQVATQTLKAGSMAPNSWFNYGVALGSKTLAAGRYTLKLHLTSGKRTWNFNRAFRLSAQRTREHNTTVKAVKQPVNWWLWIILAILALLLLITGAYWLGKRRTRS